MIPLTEVSGDVCLGAAQARSEPDIYDLPLRFFRFEQMRSIGHILIAALAVVMSGSAVADAPPEPPGLHRPSCSLNGRWCVEPTSQKTDDERQAGVRVFKRAAGKSVPAWLAPLAIRGRPTVTNDGACVIDFASGSNLIALDATSSDPAFTLVCRGSAPRVLSMDKFIVNFAALPRTTSHRRWAESFGLDEHDHWVVRTVEGRTFVIDPHDGHLVSGSWAR